MGQRSPHLPKLCIICDQPFVPEHGSTRTCSPACRKAREKANRARGRQMLAPKPCAICGMDFHPYREAHQVCSTPSCRKEAFRRRAQAFRERNPIYYGHEYWARFYARNREAQLAAKKAWYQQNRAYAMARAKEWAAANPERRRAIRRRYKQSDRRPSGRSGQRHVRLARKRDAPGRATAEQLTARWAYYGGRCWMCLPRATSGTT